jgi:hypothetical protein
MVARRSPYRASNFGRVQDVRGVRHLPEIGKNRRRTCHPPGLREIGVHQLVYALFPNGPPLRPGDTVDHITSTEPSNNYWRGLRRATKSEQVLNRVLTAKSKQSEVEKRGMRVRGRRGDGPWRTWDSKCEAARATGVDRKSIQNSIKEGRAVATKAGVWTFEAVPREDPDLPDERWYALVVDGETLWLSSAGRVRRSGGDQGNGAAHYGTNNNGYRRIGIKGKQLKVHNLIMMVIAQHYEAVGWGDREQWRFAPAPPDDGETYTVEHRDTDLDDDGCLSNAFGNLDGWFTKREQNLSRAKRSMPGKPVRARGRITRVVTEHANAYAAAAALGLSRSLVNAVCNGKYTSRSYELSFMPQPDLVRVHTEDVDDWVHVSTETELWEDVDPADPRLAAFL